MDDQIITDDWSYTRSRSIKEGWRMFWWVVKYSYLRLFMDYGSKTNYADKLLADIYQEEFWLLLSGYEADF